MIILTKSEASGEQHTRVTGETARGSLFLPYSWAGVVLYLDLVSGRTTSVFTFAHRESIGEV